MLGRFAENVFEALFRTPHRIPTAQEFDLVLFFCSRSLHPVVPLSPSTAIQTNSISTQSLLEHRQYDYLPSKSDTAPAHYKSSARYPSNNSPPKGS